jgi:hypothetical protein
MSNPTDTSPCGPHPAGSRPCRAAAVAWLLTYLLAVVACLTTVQSGRSINSFAQSLPAARGDIRLYWDVVRRVERGESYYTAMHAELNRQGYPTSSVFNWRTPAVFWLMARLPDPTGGATLILCAAAALIAAGFLSQRAELGDAAAYAGGFLMLGAVLPCFVSDVCVLPVEWGAVCVAWSLYSFSRGRAGVAVVLGTLAAFFCELSLGYALIMSVRAAWSGQRRELMLWTTGLSAFAGWFVWHAVMVSHTIGASDVVDARAWLQFGGLRFLVATAQMNCWLLPLPSWLAATYLPTALLGLAHWKSGVGRRCGLFAATYSVLFLCVGQPFNQYWGLLLAPPLAWGAGRAPRVLCDLWRIAAGTCPHATHNWSFHYWRRMRTTCCESVRPAAGSADVSENQHLAVSRRKRVS